MDKPQKTYRSAARIERTWPLFIHAFCGRYAWLRFAQWPFPFAAFVFCGGFRFDAPVEKRAGIIRPGGELHTALKYDDSYATALNDN